MKRFIPFLLIALAFASCEDSMFLKSEKKMKKDLQGVWQREFLGDTSIHYREYWTFDGNKLYTTKEEPDTYDEGAPDSVNTDQVDTIVISGFSIDARVFRAFLKLQVEYGRDTAFVDKWEFVTLKKGVLDIAADNPIGPGVEQREFFKVR